MKTVRLTCLWLCLSTSATAFAEPVPPRVEARRLIEAQNWIAAARAYEAIIASSLRGEDWYWYGLSLSKRDNCRTALLALDRAVELGVDGTRPKLRSAHVAAARCASHLGRRDEALDHLSIAKFRYGFDDFAALKADPAFARLLKDGRFRRLAGEADIAPGRVAGWRSDLDEFVQLVRSRHPSPFHKVSEAEWMNRVSLVREEIARSDDIAIVVAFMRLAALIGDGHTSVYPPLGGSEAYHLLPIWPVRFGADWYVYGAAPGYADLVGARITAINGKPMPDILKALGAMLPSDNDWTIAFVGNTALQFHELAVSAAGGRATQPLLIQVQPAAGGPIRRSLPKLPIDRDPTLPQPPGDWATMAACPVPLWLSRTDEPFFAVPLANGSAVYAQVNRIANSDNETLENFATRLGAMLASQSARRLIVDLRHNNGGSGSLNWGFVRALVRSPTLQGDGSLYVITGPRTFSAAMNLASMMETHLDPIFVGEPTGSRPNFYGEDTPFTLPYSKLSGSISSAWFQGGFTSDDSRPFIAPHIPAPLTARDVSEGRDPALEALGYSRPDYQLKRCG